MKFKLHIEERVKIPGIHAECFGTPDAWFYNDRTKTLHVFDLKHGHSFVDEFENLQLIAYAYGILDQMPHLKRDDLQIELTIVQPRCFNGSGPVRTWRCTMADLWPHIERMAQAATIIMHGEPNLNTGSHCAHCSAIHACPAAQRSAGTAIDVSATLVPAQMDPASLGLVLRRVQYARDMLKAMEGGLIEEAEALLRSGTRVPGYELQPGRGKVEWNRPVEEIVALGLMFGVDLAKPGVITPTQAKKVLKDRGIDTAVISDYTVATSGALQLKQSDESLTRRIFAARPLTQE